MDCDAYKSEVEADLATMVARLGEDGEREAAGDEGEEGLETVEEGFRLLIVALFDTHDEGLCRAGRAASERVRYVQQMRDGGPSREMCC